MNWSRYGAYVVSGSPFVGRAAELARVDEMLVSLVDGTGSSLLISGEAGMGKSALVAAMLERATKAGVQVRSATALEFERGMSLRVFHDLLGPERSVSGESGGRLFQAPPAPFGAAPAIPERLLDDVVESVERLADGPTLLVADDLHWADLWSLQALSRLVRLTARLPLFVVAAVRTPTTDRDLATMQDSFVRAGATRVSLAPLPEADALDLAQDWLGERFGERANALVARAAGHPLYLTQMLLGIEADAFAGNGPSPNVRELPRSIEEAVSWRVVQLREEVQQFVAQAAVLGPRFPLADLESLCGREPEEVRELVAEAADAGIIFFDGPLLRFGHDLLRDAIYLRVPELERRQTHRVAAEVLRAAGAGPLAVARHVVRGASPGDEHAINAGLSAAGEVAMSDPRTALELLRLTDGVATDADHRRRINRARAEPLAWTGQVDEAIELLSEAVDASEGDERSTLRWVRAGVHVLRNETDLAIADLDQAIVEAAEPETQARLMAEAALARAAGGRGDVLELAERAIAAGRASGDAVAESLAQSAAARALSGAHDYAGGVTRSKAALGLAEELAGDSAHRFVPWFFHGLCLLDIDDHAGVERCVQQGRVQAGRDGSDWALPLYAGLAGSLAYRQGRLDDAAAEAGAGADLADDSAIQAAAVWCRAIEAQVALHRDDVNVARELMVHADRSFASGRAMLGIDHYVHVQSQIALLDGDDAGAHQLLAGGWDLFAEIAPSCHPVLATDLVRVALARGDHDGADRTARAMESVAAASGVLGIEAVALRCQGLTQRDPELLRRARDVYTSVGRMADAALCDVDVVDVLLLRGQASAAEALISETVANLDSLGLVSDRRRLSEQAERNGIATPASPQPSGRWSLLTGTERDVVVLVGEGLSNADIARRRGNSIRTIESHLHRVYTKLKIPTRTQLALEASARS